MQTLKGCHSCRNTRPPNQIISESGGTIVQCRCTDCGTVWLRRPLPHQQAVALAAAAQAPPLLRQFADAVQAADKAGYEALLDEIKTVHGPVAAAALRGFLTAIGASAAASLDIPAPANRFPKKQAHQPEGDAAS